VFIGVHGMDVGTGFTTPNLMESETNQALVATEPRQWEQAQSHFSESVRLLEVCGAKLELARTHRAWGLACQARGAHEEAQRHLELEVTQLL
jgi:hypothetical protein